MIRTTLYFVRCDDAVEGELAYPTLAAAKAARRNQEPGDGAITKRTIVGQAGLRELLCALFNRIGYSETQVEVLPDRPTKREGR